RFDIVDAPPRLRRWWMVLTPTGVDVCDADPGHEVAATVNGSMRDLVSIWRGDRTWSSSLRRGAVTITGSTQLQHQVPIWFGPSRFATVPRPGDPDAALAS
ncbi:MAG: hypothetical protein L0H26_01640, partial [Microlunatus sp.]|nr:hypothetical protein [Microlunatus sp.]